MVSNAARSGGRWRSRPPILAALALASGLFFCGRALAGNGDSYYLSGDAALQGGAITANARGGGAAWYNPAGLARLPELRFDVSINAFAIRFGGHPDFDASGNSQVKRLIKLDFNVVPSGLTVTRRWHTVGLAFGVFVPEQHETVLRTQVVTPVALTFPSTKFGFDVYERVQEYSAGPSFGLQLDPRVDFGASLLATYRSQLSIAGTSYAAAGTDGAIGVTQHQSLDAQQVGLQAIIGLQLHPKRDSELGFTLRLPTVRLFEIAQNVDMQTAATSGSAGSVGSDSDFQQHNGLALAQVKPMRFHVGASRDFGASRLALELSYQAPLRNSELGLDWKPMLNARIGGRHRVSERFTIGGGLFTDRSPVRTARNFGDSSLDFYGVTIAMDWGSHYEVSAVNGDVRPQRLDFGTTIALSYAIGVGDIVRGEFKDQGPLLSVDEVPSATVAHEFVLHVSSSLIE